MRVFRVQRQSYDGDGPYVSDSPLMGFRNEDPSPADPKYHPFPGDDPLFLEAMPIWDWRYYFGFASIEAAQGWFYYRPWLEAMEAGGYVLAEYEIESEDVVQGEKQLAFRLSYATKIGYRPLVESLTKPKGLALTA